MATTIWKGHLTFGLVSIPVRLHKAARKERVRLQYVHADTTHAAQTAWTPGEPPEPETESTSRPGENAPAMASPLENSAVEIPTAPPPPVSRVEQQLVREGDSSPIDRRELARGYEYEPDRFVVVEQEELRRLRRKTSPDMRISQFVRLEEIDPLYFETSYYVVPDAGGEKPYAVLFAVLKQTGYVALSGVAMHGRDHVVVVRAGRSGLIAHTMFYTDEIHAENEFTTDVELVTSKELELGSAFVEALAASFDPGQFKDAYREELRALIEGKAARQAVTPAAPAQPAPPAVDILEALKASLAQAKKVQAAPAEPARKMPAKVTEIKRKPQRRKA
jgi:DNA end-binding protein Ku